MFAVCFREKAQLVHLDCGYGVLENKDRGHAGDHDDSNNQDKAYLSHYS
jgi:hypothetical protein